MRQPLFSRDRLILYLQIGVIILAVVAYPVIAAFVPTKHEPLVAEALVVTIVGSAIIVLDLQLSALRRLVVSKSSEEAALSTVVRPLSLAKALDAAIADRRKVSTIKVFAATSHHIQNLIPDHRAEQCELLLHNGQVGDGGETLRALLDEVVANWVADCDAGRCGTLILRRFDFLPQVYLVVVDQAAVIVGTYDLREEEFSRVWPNDPFLFTGESASGREIVAKWSSWFDRLFEQARTGSGSNFWYANRAPEPSSSDVYPPMSNAGNPPVAVPGTLKP